MTLQDIKSSYTMTEIVRRYGGNISRAGFTRCPSHNDKNASFKIYERSGYCFACGYRADVIDYVSSVLGISFKDAFVHLGGVYTKDREERKRIVEDANRKAELKKAKEIELREERRINYKLIDAYRNGVEEFIPLTDEWCMCVNKLQLELYRMEMLDEKANQKHFNT